MKQIGTVVIALSTIVLGHSYSSVAEAGEQAAAAPIASASSDLKLIKEVLGDGIYLFRAPAALDRWTATNVVVIVNEDDVTVFDSATRPSTTRMVIAEIRALTDKPVRTLINSHWHMDHWSGNNEFVKAYPGIQIIATVETRDYMKRMIGGFLTDSTRAGLTQRREALENAIKTGRQTDGTPLTPDVRRQQEHEIEKTEQFLTEMNAVPRVLPNMAFRDSFTFWRGGREFRLISVTGDATGSTVLYLPGEKILVAGDVLVRPENGDGPPPWTTNSYAIAPWLASLRRLETLDANVIVPGQGPALRGKAYLTLTANLFASIVAQVHAALERGMFKLDDVLAAVDVDSIGRQYTPTEPALRPAFKALVSALVRKALQESLDGVVR